jgi:PAS domain S-box-containing protein
MIDDPRQDDAHERPLRRIGGTCWDMLDTAIFLHDPQTGQIVDCNRAAERLALRSADEMRELSPRYFSAEGAAPLDEALRLVHAAAAGQPQRFGWLGGADEDFVPVTVHLERVTIDDQPYVLAEVRKTTPSDDLKAETLALRRLRASEARYRTVFEAAHDAIFLMRGARFVDCNEATLRLFGGTRDQIIGRRPDELSPPRQRDGRPSRESAAELINALGPAVPLSFEWTHCRVDGTPFEAEVSLNTLQLDQDDPTASDVTAEHAEPREGKFTLAVVRDVTHRKQRLQRQQQRVAEGQQRQKLESLGTLAAGVAHEINNPLMGILNYAALLESRLRDPQLSSWASGIAREGERVSTIVKNLLAFARQEKAPALPARIDEIIDSTLTLLGASLRQDGIALSVEVAPDLPPLICRSNQIQQVLVNLLTNARDALNERYPTRHFDKRLELHATAHETPEGRAGVRISVTDYGVGVPAELHDRIFDPFFTTKACDRGTGLGLSISFGLAREHGGALQLDASFEQGSRFQLVLPSGGPD